MNTNPTDNLKPYKATVATPDGRHFGNYLDWFENNEQAVAGFAEIMAEQGYPRVRVEIGELTIVHILP